MAITKNKKVYIEYTLKNSDGEILDSSTDAEPLEYIHGKGQLIPGLEAALEGKTEGETLSVEVKAADAYGEHNKELIYDIPRAKFEDAELKVGMQFEATSPDGSHIVTILDIGDDTVSVDTNHPLAGVDLFFDVKVISITDPDLGELISHSGCGGCTGCGSSYYEDDYYDDEDSGCGGCCGCH